MRLSCSLGSLLSINEILSCAKTLSETDVDAIWVPETWGMESFAMLGAVSAAAPLPRIGSSIVNVYSRSPAAIAMGAATVDTLSGGRLLLGIGASSPAIVEGLHGVRYESPLKRVRETVEIVRLATSGRRVDYEGELFSLNGFRLLVRPVQDGIPVYLAAVNRGMVRLAWDVGDGVIFYLRPLDEMRRTIRAMHKESGRRIDVACQLITCVSDDDGGEAAVERARRTIAFYVAVGDVYRNFLSANGFGDEAASIYGEYRSSGLAGVHRYVSDGMLDALAVCGTPKSCKKRLGAFRDAGLDLPILQFNPVGDVAGSFALFAETFFGYDGAGSTKHDGDGSRGGGDGGGGMP
ncbi:MAG: LLM class flavin-dependent oxidoreductase [Thaumarchaeota archaeon]|nr:LLM class flavin-dependent oxidoreductase [Nitrososphaerota archaeon]